MVVLHYTGARRSGERESMASYHQGSSANEVVNEIADRRRSLHYVKDRRISMERKTEWAKNVQHSGLSYSRAWGESLDDVGCDVLMIKEINILWGWFQAELGLATKQDKIENFRVVGVFAKMNVFGSYQNTENFVNSITTDEKGIFCFADLITSMGNSEVSVDDVLSLRQFVKQLKALKKERKKRQTTDSTTNRQSMRLDMSFAKGQEDAQKIQFNKAKSDNNMNPDPPPLEQETSKSGPSSRLPLLKNNSYKKEKDTPRRVSPPPSARKYANTSDNSTARVAPKLASNATPFSSLNISENDADMSPSSSLSPPKSPRRLDPLDSLLPSQRRLKKDKEKPSQSSTKPVEKTAPLRAVRTEYQRKLSRMSSSEMASESPGDEDLPTKSLGDNKRTNLSGNSFRRRGSQKTLKKSDSTASNSSFTKQSSARSLKRGDSNASAGSASNKNTGKLTRQSSGLNRADSGAASAGVANMRAVKKQPSGRALLRGESNVSVDSAPKAKETSRFTRQPSGQMLQRGDSNVSASKSKAPNKLKESSKIARQSSGQKYRRGDSNVSTGAVSRSKTKSKELTPDGTVMSEERGEGGGVNDNILKSVRKSYSKQLSKMSSMGEDVPQKERRRSSRIAPEDLPKSDGPQPLKKSPSDDSIESIKSFDSIHKFQNISSKNDSFGDTIVLRSMSGGSMEI